jgi:hypothetical protein
VALEAERSDRKAAHTCALEIGAIWQGQWQPGMTGRTRDEVKVGEFDASEYLDNEEVVAEYLTAALEDANPKYFYRPLVMSPRRAE